MPYFKTVAWRRGGESEREGERDRKSEREKEPRQRTCSGNWNLKRTMARRRNYKGGWTHRAAKRNRIREGEWKRSGKGTIKGKGKAKKKAQYIYSDMFGNCPCGKPAMTGRFLMQCIRSCCPHPWACRRRLTVHRCLYEQDQNYVGTMKQTLY